MKLTLNASMTPFIHQAPAQNNDAPVQCFVVSVNGERFGLPVESVQTVFNIEAVTPVPLGPREIVGLVNLRGKIATAVSLRWRLNIADEDETRARIAVGMEHHGENFALVIDEVGDVINLTRDTQIALPPQIHESRAKFTKAAYRLDVGILSLLDVGAIFDFPRYA